MIFLIRVLICMILLAAATGWGTVHAQTSDEQPPPMNSQAEEFFNECVKRPIVSISEETDMAFCACTAVNLHQWSEDPARKTEPDYLGRFRTKTLDKNVLISQIYGPCLYIPIYDMSYDECLKDKESKFMFSRGDLLDGACHCIAQGDSDYFRQFAKPFLELRISEGANIDDPIKEVKRDMNFYDAHYHLETDCYEEYVKYQ